MREMQLDGGIPGGGRIDRLREMRRGISTGAHGDRSGVATLKLLPGNLNQRYPKDETWIDLGPVSGLS